MSRAFYAWKNLGISTLFLLRLGIEQTESTISIRHRNCIQCIIPPYIFDKMLDCEDMATREAAVETLVAQHVGMRSLRIQPPPGNELSVLKSRIAEYQVAIS